MSPLKSCAADRLHSGGQRPDQSNGGAITEDKRKKSEMDELVMGLVAVSLAMKRLSKKALSLMGSGCRCPLEGRRGKEHREDGKDE